MEALGLNVAVGRNTSYWSGVDGPTKFFIGDVWDMTLASVDFIQ